MLRALPRSLRTAALGVAAVPFALLAAGCSKAPSAPLSPSAFGSAGTTAVEAGPTGLGITPVVLPGNPTCSSVPGYTTDWLEVKLDNDEWLTPGTYGAHFTVHANAEMTHLLDWSAGGAAIVKAVLVKGSNAANLYSYNASTPPVVSSDTYLHSPVNSSGRPAAISHVTFCYVPVPTGDEGCGQGFWKNLGATSGQWAVAGVSQSATVGSVFSIAAFPSIGSTTLHAALSLAGGSGPEGAARNLTRAAVAAYVNAQHPDVAFPLTAGSVVSQVNAALVKGSDTDNQWRQRMLALATSLDAYNNLGCPL